MLTFSFVSFSCRAQSATALFSRSCSRALNSASMLPKCSPSFCRQSGQIPSAPASRMVLWSAAIFSRSSWYCASRAARVPACLLIAASRSLTAVSSRSSAISPAPRPARTRAMNSAFFCRSISSDLICARCLSIRAVRSAISRPANPSSALRRRNSLFFSRSPSIRWRSASYEPAVFSIRRYSASSSAIRASWTSSFFACFSSASLSFTRFCCCWRSRLYASFFSASTFCRASSSARSFLRKSRAFSCSAIKAWNFATDARRFTRSSAHCRPVMAASSPSFRWSSPAFASICSFRAASLPLFR